MKFFEKTVHDIVSKRVESILKDIESFASELKYPHGSSPIGNAGIDLHNKEVHEKMARKAFEIKFVTQIG